MTEQLTYDDKVGAFWQGKLSPKLPDGNPLPFQSPEAEKAYKESINRIRTAIEMKKLPDRVPVTTFPGMYPWFHAGMRPCTIMKNVDKPSRISYLNFSQISIGAP